MSWPLAQDYNEAIQSPNSSFSDAELRVAEPVLNAVGIPIPRSGNFADVYEMRSSAGRWAIKCFTREVHGLRDRYAAISRHLQEANLPFAVEFTFLEQGIRVRGQWYPVLKMEWVEGLTLNDFVRQYADKPAMLKGLVQIWVRMAARLREARMAHADLQHGNVLLVPGSSANALAVKLIDYDGMWVPALAKTPSGEAGHPAYQHPQRLREGTYNPEVDRFPLLVIATALHCLRVGGRPLWDRYDTGDNLLFRQGDLETPAQSPLFDELRKIDNPQARSLVERLAQACQVPLEQAPLLPDLLPEEKPAKPPAPAPARQAEANAFQGIGEEAPAPSRRKSRDGKGRSRLPWVVGGAVAACALLGGLLFLALSRNRPRDTGAVAQVPQTPPPPPVATTRRQPPPPVEPPVVPPVPVADTPKEPNPLFQDDFHDPKSGWRDKENEGYAEGKYRLRRRGWTSSAWNAPFSSPADFACDVEGRALGKEGDRWGLSIYQVLGKEADKQYGIQVTVSASGQVEVAPSVHLPSVKDRGPRIGPIANAAVKKGAEWNTLRVVVRGRRVEVHVNGTRVMEPFDVERAIAPGSLALESVGSTGEGLAEFRRFTVWPADALPPMPQSVAVNLEGENLKILKKSSDFPVGGQDMRGFPTGKWGGDAQLVGKPAKVGDWADLEVPVPAAGKYTVVVHLTKAPDYGIVQFRLDGKPLGDPIDGFEPGKVIRTGPVSLGTVDLKKGPAVLRVEVTGSNPGAFLRDTQLPGTWWGLDSLALEPGTPSEHPQGAAVSRDRDEGVLPLGSDGKPLNFDFETGTLKDWTAEGEAFQGQPIKGDTVNQRRRDMRSEHQGDYWVGTHERRGDGPQGTLTSVPFKVTHPWCSFLIGGGSHDTTCVELVRKDTGEVFARASGFNTENLRRVAIDLNPHLGKEIVIRLVDRSPDEWGHINFDDFRFHDRKPEKVGLAAPPPEDLVRAALEEFRKLVPDLAGPNKGPRPPATVTFRPSFWQCSDGETILTVDLRGNASYKRVRGWSPLGPEDKTPAPPARDPVRDAVLVQKTRELAKPWLPADQVTSLKPAIKRETLLLAQLPEGAVVEKPGRTIVRLLGPDDVGGGQVQAMFDPKGDLLRFDIAFAGSRTRDLCPRDLLARTTPSMNPAADQPLTLGCFFDPSEHRFEISAFSVEGEPFLKLDQASNPFGHDNFDLKLSHRVAVPRYRESQDYHWWCWAWWHHYGCVGGFRGDWLEREGKGGWEYPRHEVLHHRSLASYETVQGPTGKTKTIQQPDGPMDYPHAVSQTFKPAFSTDLEQCNVAFFFTHGGPIEGFYQMRRGLDQWVALAPAGHKLGTGKLRHLFLDGCAAFTYRRDPKAAHLVKTWIRRAPAAGLRTACGGDGETKLLDRSGWRFFGPYNKGESISDAWTFAMLDEAIDNCPVTAAYGETMSEAVETLLGGRFSDQKAQAKAVAISVWSEAKVP